MIGILNVVLEAAVLIFTTKSHDIVGTGILISDFCEVKTSMDVWTRAIFPESFGLFRNLARNLEALSQFLKCVATKLLQMTLSKGVILPILILSAVIVIVVIVIVVIAIIVIVIVIIVIVIIVIVAIITTGQRAFLAGDWGAALFVDRG